MKPGRKLKAVIPGGSSAKVLRADEKFKIKEKQADGSMADKEITIEEIPMDFDTLAAVGSMAGSGGVIVMDDSRDMVWALQQRERILRPRELRPMHAVPRRFAVDEEDHRSHGQRRRRAAGPIGAQERGG